MTDVMMSRIVRRLMVIALALATIGLQSAEAAGQSEPLLVPIPGYDRSNPAASWPGAIAIDDTHGIIYVGLTLHSRIISVEIAELESNPDAPVWRSPAALDYSAMPKADAAPSSLEGLAVDAAGNLYALDALFGEVERFTRNSFGEFNRDGTFLASTRRRRVHGKPISGARDIAARGDQVYLLDSGNDRVLRTSPPYSNWDLMLVDPQLRSPVGFDVRPDGHLAIAAARGRELGLVSDGGSLTFVGRETGHVSSLGGPREVAFLPQPPGTAITDATPTYAVVDIPNQRVRVLDRLGRQVSVIGIQSLYGYRFEIDVDSSGRIFVLDSSAPVPRIVAFLGETGPEQDLVVADFDGDDGDEPSDRTRDLGSPDILVLNKPWDKRGTPPPTVRVVPKRSHYVYVRVQNRGRLSARDAKATLWWLDPAGSFDFQDAWSGKEIATEFDGVIHHGNGIRIGEIKGQQSHWVGPWLWWPPDSDARANVSCANRADDWIEPSRLFLGVRVSLPSDSPSTTKGRDHVYAENNVAVRPVELEAEAGPVGAQNTLVIHVTHPNSDNRYRPDHGPNPVEATERWLRTASLGNAWLWTREEYVTVPLPSSYYHRHGQHPLFALVVDAIGAVIMKFSTDPSRLDRGFSNWSGGVSHIVIVSDDPEQETHVSTPVPWPYRIGARRWALTASVLGPKATYSEWRHAFGHQLCMSDIYPSIEPRDGERMTLDTWDLMGLARAGAVPTSWSQDRVGWLRAAGLPIHYRPRPVTEAITGEADLVDVGSALSGTRAIALGLTTGVNTLSKETHSLWIEARNTSAQGMRGDDSRSGVIVYRANERLGNGEGPLRAESGVLTPGESVVVNGTGITVAVLPRAEGMVWAATRVQYTVEPVSSGGVDLYFEEGRHTWLSPDVWFDNQRDGGGYGAPDSDLELRSQTHEAPIAGEQNRVYARVRNRGPSDATQVVVNFSLSSPQFALGGVGDYVHKATATLPLVRAGSFADAYFTWTPTSSDDALASVRVVASAAGGVEDQPHDNTAHRALRVGLTEHEGEYTSASLPFRITNADLENGRTVFFRVDGLPDDWAAVLPEATIRIGEGERHEGLFSVTPPAGLPDGRDLDIHLSAWTPRGDTLVPLGGATLRVGLRRRTDATVTASVVPCDSGALASIQAAMTADGAYRGRVDCGPGPCGPPPPELGCVVVQYTACAQPGQAGQRVSLSVIDAEGYPVHHDAVLGDDGCVADVFLPDAGGEHRVRVTFQGNKLVGPAEAEALVAIPTPKSGDPDGDGVPSMSERQGDHDGDGIPNGYDADADGDGIPDGEDCYAYGTGPFGPYSGQPELCDGLDNDCNGLTDDGLEDLDGDGLVFCADLDDDGDGMPDLDDSCPTVAGRGDDADGDGLGDLCDPCPQDALPDMDADGVCNIDDLCPGVFDVESVGQGRDGSGDDCDP
ncbi:MAG: hypothetical protein IV100_08795 [Myxococcales bacterium]|nr:hypothetical protein [Myxococcales bacterium]